MLKLSFAFVCMLMMGYLVLLVRSFEFLSTTELKRQARSGNRRAKSVYSVRGPYGSQVFILLWAFISIFTAVMVVLLENVLWTWAAIIVSVAALLTIHVVLPWSKYPTPSLGMAAFVSRPLVRFLAVMAPLSKPVGRVADRWISRNDLKRIHSKDELIEILEHTRIQDDQFSADEIDIAIHALTFADKKITEIMTPRTIVRSVRSEDVLSPVLLGELHESGFSRFPVTESEKGKYVGILYSKDLSDLHGNKSVAQTMRRELYYVNEFTPLDNVLNAFLRTQHHLFIVVNEFEEVTGIVTIEDVLEQVIGKKIVDEFDKYEDLRAVALQNAQSEANNREGQTV